MRNEISGGRRDGLPDAVPGPHDCGWPLLARSGHLGRPEGMTPLASGTEERALKQVFLFAHNLDQKVYYGSDIRQILRIGMNRKPVGPHFFHIGR